ncbi:MAG: UDP-glucose 4-epimerase [Actinomycetota bacterium]
MTILVTGGAGYIGSHTVRALRGAGRDVVVLDTLERGSVESLLGAPLVVGDIADEALVESVCREREVTAVIHFAAHKSVGESMERPGMYWTNNVQGTVHLVEGMSRAGVQHLVFSSSAAVYGNPDRVPITEDMPLRPENVYAESKAMMERVIAWYGITSGLRSVSLRYFNAAGASSDGAIGEDWTVTTNLVPLVMKAVLGASGPVRVFGDDYPTPDGTGVRDYIHVEDLATAHVAALEHLERGGDDLAVNLGTGVGSSVREILDATAVAAGRPVPHEIVGRRIGDPAVVYADAGLAAERLGWRAERTLTDIIASAFAWHSSRI